MKPEHLRKHSANPELARRIMGTKTAYVVGTEADPNNLDEGIIVVKIPDSDTTGILRNIDLKNENGQTESVRVIITTNTKPPVIY
jgi:hypothetical protein